MDQLTIHKGFLNLVSKFESTPATVRKFSLPKSLDIKSFLKDRKKSYSRQYGASSSSQLDENPSKKFPFDLFSSLSKEELDIVHSISRNRLVLSFIPNVLRLKILSTICSHGGDLVVVLKNNSRISYFSEAFGSDFKFKTIQSIYDDFSQDSTKIFFFPLETSNKILEKSDLEFFLNSKKIQMVAFFDFFESFPEENQGIFKIIENLYEKFPETKLVTFDVFQRKNKIDDLELLFKRFQPEVLAIPSKLDKFCFKVEENLGFSELAHFVREKYFGLPGVVIYNSNEHMESMANYLNELGISSQFYNSRVPKNEKSLRKKRWKDEEIKVLVTSKNSLLLNFHQNLSFVIFKSIPESFEDFLKIIDSINQKQQTFIDVVFSYRYIDRAHNVKMILNKLHPKPYLKNFYSLINFLDTKTTCRKVMIHDFFSLPSSYCNNCDNCSLKQRQYLRLERNCYDILKTIQGIIDDQISYEHLIEKLKKELGFYYQSKLMFESTVYYEIVNHMIYEGILEEFCINDRVLVQVNKKIMKNKKDYYKNFVANDKQIEMLQNRIFNIVSEVNPSLDKIYDEESLHRMSYSFIAQDEIMQGYIRDALKKYGVVEEYYRKLEYKNQFP